MRLKLCKRCNLVKFVTKKFWTLVGPNTKRAKERPQDIGKAYGCCKECRNKAQIKYQKTLKGKKTTKAAYYARGDDYKTLLCVQVKIRDKVKKEELIKFKGGKCEKCGYNKCSQALDFHHINPSVKEFGVNANKGQTIESLLEEAKKCELLCSNCHREYHAKESASKLEEQIEFLKTTKYRNNEYIGD